MGSAVHLLIVLAALASTVSGASCRRGNERSREGRASASGAVAWTTDVPGEAVQLVRGGRLLTTPIGHEEQLLPAVAAAVREWAEGCPRSRLPREPLAAFRLEISAAGAVRNIAGVGQGSVDDPLCKCLVENGRKRGIAAARPGVDVVVDLALDLGGRP